MASSTLLNAHLFLRGLGEQTREGLLLPLTPCTVEGEYFLPLVPDLASCHNWVVSRVMPLKLCGPLIAQMVMSVTRQVVQEGLCMHMTRTGYNRRVFLLGRSVSTGEAGLPSVFSPGDQTGASVYFLMALSSRDVSLYWQTSLYPKESCVFSKCVIIFTF